METASVGGRERDSRGMSRIMSASGELAGASGKEMVYRLPGLAVVVSTRHYRDITPSLLTRQYILSCLATAWTDTTRHYPRSAPHHTCPGA